jgi:hypothetical protein
MSPSRQRKRPVTRRLAFTAELDLTAVLVLLTVAEIRYRYVAEANDDGGSDKRRHVTLGV